MTEQSTPSVEERQILPESEPSQYQPLLNFLLGAFFGCIPVGLGLDLSSYMTHTPVLDYAVWKLILAASFPVFCGFLGVALKGKFLKALGDVLSSTVI